MMFTTLTALVSHWRRRPFQAFTLILGLALATALWSGVQAINAEARASYQRAATTIGGGALPELTRRDGAAISQETYINLRRTGVLVSPIVDGWVSTDSGRVRLIGLDPLTSPPNTSAAGAAMSGDPREFLAGDGVILAEATTAERLTGIGRKVRVVDNLPPGLAFTDVGVAQILLEMEGHLSRLILLSDQPLDRLDLTEIAPQLDLKKAETAEDLGRLTDSFHLNLTAFGLLSFAVGLFIVHGSVGLAFEQRRPVFRTLRALGVSTRTLIYLLMAELLVFAILAGLIGIALGYVIAAALLPDVAATLRGLYGASVEGTLTLSPLWWGIGLVIAVFGTALAAAGSLWQVARLPVLAPAHPRAWSRASSSVMWGQLCAAGLLLIIALGTMVFGSGLLSGFVMLGALLLAAALALPAALSGALALCERVFGNSALVEWFWADTRQQLPGLSLALMALMLALAANIGVGTMVSSFRLTFTGWLEQRLVSELFVTAENDAQAAEMIEWLRPRSDAVLPIWSVDRQIAGAPGEIYGVADHKTYRDNWPLLDALPDVWDVVARNEAILINEQLARREALRPGDTLLLPDGWQAPIAGIYSDYGNPHGQVLMATDALTSRYPDVLCLRYGIRVAPEDSVGLAQALVSEFGLPSDNVVDQASIKNFSLGVFERTFAVTGALNALTLAVAGFAILTSLLTLAAMRLPQLAPVWALGLTRKTLANIELLRAILLAALTIVFAIPVGLALAWVLLAVINVEAFGWRLPMHLFPKDWAVLAVLSLGAAALASLWPARKLARLPPYDLIRLFSHER